MKVVPGFAEGTEAQGPPDTCPVHVVSHNVRAGTRIPGEINAVLYRAYSTPAQCILCDFPIAKHFQNVEGCDCEPHHCGTSSQAGVLRGKCNTSRTMQSQN